MTGPWKYFLRLFVPAALVILVGSGLYGNADIEREYSRLRTSESLSVGLGAGVLRRSLDEVRRELVFLSGHSHLHAAVATGSAEAVKELGEELVNLSRKRIYDQARWIDERGMERVRVDLVKGRPWLTPPEHLQNKAARYYFSEAMKLEPGEVYLSPLDLNVEQGKVEIPYKPVLRLATPLADNRGARRGIVILNYLGREMLDAFATATAGIGDHAMLLNSDGFWLKSPRPEEEWGFMFQRKETLGSRAPDAWSAIKAGESGQIRTGEGLWTWDTVDPLPVGQRTGAATAPSPGPMMASGSRGWKVVAHLSADRLVEVQMQTWLRLGAVALGLLGLLAFGSWKLAASSAASLRQVEQQRQLLAAMEEGVYGIDDDGLCTFINRAGLAMLGLTEAEVLGKNPHLLFHHHRADGADYPWHECPVFVTLWDREARQSPADWFCRKDGSGFPVALSVTPLKTADEKWGAEVVFRDISLQQRMEEELRRLATTDELTGLANRRHFLALLDQEWSRHKRYGGMPVAVLMVDLDHFKAVNDALGHAGGDEVLRHFAHILQKSLRKTDIAGRLGGEEFGILLPGSDLDSARLYAERLRIMLAEQPLVLGEQRLAIRVSIGVTSLAASDADQDAAMRRADAALYRAKNAGRDRVEAAATP